VKLQTLFAFSQSRQIAQRRLKVSRLWGGSQHLEHEGEDGVVAGNQNPTAGAGSFQGEEGVCAQRVKDPVAGLEVLARPGGSHAHRQQGQVTPQRQAGDRRRAGHKWNSQMIGHLDSL